MIMTQKSLQTQHISGMALNITTVSLINENAYGSIIYFSFDNFYLSNNFEETDDSRAVFLIHKD